MVIEHASIDMQTPISCFSGTVLSRLKRNGSLHFYRKDCQNIRRYNQVWTKKYQEKYRAQQTLSKVENQLKALKKKSEENLLAHSSDLAANFVALRQYLKQSQIGLDPARAKIERYASPQTLVSEQFTESFQTMETKLHGVGAMHR